MPYQTSTQSGPGAQTLDVTDGKVIAALPNIITREDAIAIRDAHPELFKLMRNSKQWIAVRGLTACPYITKKTVIVEVALSDKDSFFEIIRLRAANMLAVRA